MIQIRKAGNDAPLTRARDFYQAAKWLVANAANFGGGAFEIWRVEQRGRFVTSELEAEFETDFTFEPGLDLL